MLKKKLRPKESLVPQAMRRAIVDNRSLIARLLNLDASMGDNELYSEILRTCLFDRQRRPNPSGTFVKRLYNGDFLPIQCNEDPENLAHNRQPMSDDELDAAVMQVYADSAYWDDHPSATAEYIVRNVVLRN